MLVSHLDCLIIRLHQGSYYSSEKECVDLALGSGIEKVLEYCRKKLKVLLLNGIKVIVVFDGTSLEMKRNTIDERQRQRAKSMACAKEMMKQGLVEQACKKFAESVSISGYLKYRLVGMLKAMQIEYIIAPYEADS